MDKLKSILNQKEVEFTQGNKNKKEEFITVTRKSYFSDGSVSEYFIKVRHNKRNNKFSLEDVQDILFLEDENEAIQELFEYFGVHKKFEVDEDDEIAIFGYLLKEEQNQ